MRGSEKTDELLRDVCRGADVTRSCDGSLRSDPHNSHARADTAALNPEADRETDSLVGWLQPPRDLTRVKREIPPFPEEEVVSWSRNTPDLVKTEDWTDQEDVERGATDTAFRTSVTTGQSGSEESHGITEDCWPRGAYA
ncbi:hypothetical protein NDU88_007362 [Pleurodeles waltl]|uniref:Uncharacterized protein n=1 Tax=Pleurodeles waltl TaxID=8319 RepID=A0AAV7VSE6_PLEWA|nr:hypothetical protein NDU88_007362 [Pleurodeles waltl]